MTSTRLTDFCKEMTDEINFILDRCSDDAERKEAAQLLIEALEPVLKDFRKA